jgi:hypothetical protein
MIYCAARFDDLYLCELTAGHDGDHALRPRCVYCDDVLGDDEVGYHLNNVCDRQAHEEAAQEWMIDDRYFRGDYNERFFPI